MATLTLCCFASTVGAANPSFEIVSRCFFVYANILQAGERLPHPEIHQFGLEKIGWVGSHLQAHQSNLEFKRVFEVNLAANKRAGVQLEKSIMDAVASRNQAQFSAVINKAVECDRLIGITTKFIPRM